MRLFDIAENYRTLFNAFDDCDNLTDDETQAYFDTLEGIEGEFDEKAESIACFIKELTVEETALKDYAAVFRKRAATKANLIKRLKALLMDNMQAVGKTKVDMPMAAISIRSNPESVVWQDDKAIVEYLSVNFPDLLNYADPEPSKTRIKEAIKDGAEIEGVELVRTQSVMIK